MPVPTGFTSEHPEGELKGLKQKKMEMQSAVREALNSQIGKRQAHKA